MLCFSKIDDKLTVYRNKNIILFGAGDRGSIVKRNLERQGIKIKYFCDNDRNKSGGVKDGIEVISFSQLCAIYDKRVLIQITSIFSREIEKQLLSHGMDSFISFEEYEERMKALYVYKTIPDSLNAYESLNYNPSYAVLQLRKICIDYAVKVKYYDLDSYNIIFLPPKTGNYTLEASFRQYNTEYVRVNHYFGILFDELNRLLEGRKIRIVTAVRDPIAQNISFFFQSNTRFCDMPEYWVEGGDVQALWDIWVPYLLDKENIYPKTENRGIRFRYMDHINKLYHNVISIQDFFEKSFMEHCGIDVYNYSFGKEAGYSIIREGNTEIFIYQLEKLDDIKEELGEFLGIKDFRLTNDNVGEKKWYAQVYKQALRELKLSREYFEFCYNTKLVRHFYREEDICGFRQRWSKNIRD